MPNQLLINLTLFLMGIRDSVSLSWIRKLILYVDPLTKKVHPSSKSLLNSLKSSLFKVILYIIVVPKVLEYFDFLSVSSIFKVTYLILTYGYLFFYNNDLLASSRRIIVWQKQQYKKNPQTCPNLTPPLDCIEKTQPFTLLSRQIKSFIFLLFYYLPIFFIETKVLSYIPYVGALCLLLSESFFNGVFYFLKTWPYDNFNIGFLEKQICYMTGYGFFISFVVNMLLSGEYATGVYLILSLWMLINSIIYSPPEITPGSIRTLKDVLSLLRSSRERNLMKNAYNEHRKKVKTDIPYRSEIVKSIHIVKPVLIITQYLNGKVSQFLKSSLQRKRSSAEDDQSEGLSEYQGGDSQSTQVSSNSSRLIDKSGNHTIEEVVQEEDNSEQSDAQQN